MIKSFNNKIKIVCFIICIFTCGYSCKSQEKHVNLPSKHPPWNLKGDTCILATLDIDYYLIGYRKEKNPEILNKVDSLIDRYCSACEEQQKDFVKYKFLTCMFTRQYDEGVRFIVEHPVNDEYEFGLDLLNREFYTTTLLSAKHLNDNNLLLFDSVNRTLLQKYEDNIRVQSALGGDKTVPVNEMAQKHFSELWSPSLDNLIVTYYLLRARIENIDVVLSELYICENKFPDKSSMGYYRLLGLIETIEDMSQKSYHFEYEL